MRQKWKRMQFVEISMHEIFCFQDKLDAVADDPQKVWDVVDDFFMEVENQLELSPNFIKSMKELDLDKDFVEVDLDKICDLFDVDAEDEDYNDYMVLKAYQEYKRNHNNS